MTLERYEKLFREFYPHLRNYLYFKMGNIEAAEDLAQDVFFKLWENRDQVRMESVKSYLYTMASNTAINHLKREQLRFRYAARQQSNPAHDMNPEYEIQHSEYKKKLEQVINELPESNRLVFLMNRIEDLKYREIADRLGLSIKAVEKRMSKAIKTLEEKLGKRL